MKLLLTILILCCEWVNPEVNRYFINRNCLFGCNNRRTFSGALIILNDKDEGKFFLWSGHELWDYIEFKTLINGDTLYIDYPTSQFHSKQDTILISNKGTMLSSIGSTSLNYSKFKKIDRNKLPTFLFELYGHYLSK